MIATVAGLGEVFDGGADIDTVSFAVRASDVTAFLSAPVVALMDTISNTENVIGSALNDDLTGDGGDVLHGAGGSDTTIFTGNRSDYVASHTSSSTIIIAGQRGGTPDGQDTVDRVEFFRFADGTFTAADWLFLPRLFAAKC
jgi:hypothetical protein